jgi:hypothetical protein
VTGSESNETARHRLSRRGFLGAAGGAALLGATGRLATPAGAATAGRKPPPPIEVLVPPTNTAPGNILLTPTASQDYAGGLMVVDSLGKLVWFQRHADTATDLQMQWYKGQPVLTWFEGTFVPPGYGRGAYRIVDANLNPVTRVRAANGKRGDLHEFFLTHRSTALFTVYDTHPADLSSIGGSSSGVLLDSLFQEVDVATGALVTEWRASDHVPLTESYMPPPSSSSSPYDFFHINSIDVDTDGNLLVSSRHTWTVYKINRTTGQIIWRLHGKKSDFKMTSGTRFSWQHHVRHHPGNVLTIFDDGDGERPVERRSRGLKLHLDMHTMTADYVQEYLPHPRVLANSQGSVQVLPNGNVFVGWGIKPYFSEYTSDGKLLYAAKLPTGVFSYRAFRSPWPPSNFGL